MSEPESGSARVLVVEDDTDLLSVLERALGRAGYRVMTATDGDSAMALALEERPDLVILDVGLPLRNGMEVTRELRERGFRAPMLMLTARNTVTDKVSGLEAGADDYLPKPFEYPELLARVGALLRRASISAQANVLRVADLALDPMTRQVTRDGTPVDLTQKEYALLEFLMRNAGKTVSRQTIAEQVWKQGVDPLTNVIDVYISYLRQKIDAESERPLLHTVRGVGYMLKDEGPR